MVALLTATLIGTAQAQEAASTEVYVTVQDYAVLRAGPGTHWDRLTVLPYGTTYRATGRTVDGDWIQIAYSGELEPGARGDFTVDGITYGWVAYWLLMWTGDILQLPIDGIVTVPIARSAGPTMILFPDEYVYVGGVDPSTRVQSPYSTPVTVEVTGRLGSADGGHFLLQFKVGGKYYWTGSWAVGVPYGYMELPDAAYLYPYGRLLLELTSELNRAGSIFDDIAGRWWALDAGQTTTCNNIPEDFSLRESSFSETDLRYEPIYRPIATALQEAQNGINAALAKFRLVCQGEGSRLVQPDEIAAALTDIDYAEQNLTVARLLLLPLQRHDPLIGESRTPP